MQPSLEVFQRIINERTGRTDLKLSNPTWLSLYRANVRMVDRYRVGRVFLAGDAAHVHSPAGGQGMNTGIQDSYNLGWKLSAVLNGARPALLDTYEEERQPVAASLLGITTRLHRQMFTDAKEIKRGPETLQLELNYRESSLSQEVDSPSALLRAGDRAPDAPLRDRDGNQMRLFDVFRGTRFTLLSLGNCVLPVPRPDLNVCAIGSGTADDFSDDKGHVRHTYGGEDGEFFVIRPDGYIGLIGSGKSIGAVEAYLDSLVSH